MKYTREQIEAELARRGVEIPGAPQQVAPQEQTQMAEQIQQPVEAQQPMQAQPQQESIHPFWSALATFNRPFERVGETLTGMIPGQAWQEALGRVKDKRKQSYEAYSKANPNAAFIGELIGELVASLPFFAAGGAGAMRLAPKASPVLQSIVGTGLGGGLYGAAQPAGSFGEFLAQAAGGTAEGMAFGTAAPAIGKTIRKGGELLKGGYQSLERALGSENRVIKDILDRMTPKEAQDMLKNAVAGRNVGVPLTPGEASGSGPVAAMEKRAGTTTEGMGKFREFKEGQRASQEESIKGLQELIQPKDRSYARDVRDSAGEIIESRLASLKEEAAPLYESVERLELKPNQVNNLLKDSNIEKSFDNIYKDAAYQSELASYKPTELKVMDYVKRDMQDRINAAYSAGENNKARLIKNSKDKLVKRLDELDKSGNYKKARGLYEEGLTDINMLQESELGKIAGKKDTQLQSIGREILDPNETDIKKLNLLRDELMAENPEAWRGMLRNEMQKRLDTKTAGKVDQPGSNFYNQILSNPREFEQWKTALKGDRKAQTRLNNMRKAFKNLQNEYSPKAQAGHAATGVDESRTGGVTKDIIKKLFGGAYDDAFIEVVTNPKWDLKFREVMKTYNTSKDPSVLAEFFETVQPAKTSGKALTALSVSKRED